MIVAFMGFLIMMLINAVINMNRLETRLDAIVDNNTSKKNEIDTDITQIINSKSPNFHWPLSRILLWSSTVIGLFAISSIILGSTILLTTVTSSYLLIVALILFIVSYVRHRQRQKFVDALPQVVEFIAQAAAGGRTIPDTIKLIAEKRSGLVGKVFRTICHSMDLGKPYVKAIREEAYKLGIIEFYFFSIIMVTQFRTGGKIVELLSSLAETLYQKRSVKLKIKALASEAKTSMIVLAVLPWFSVLATILIANDYISFLFTDPTGRFILTCCIVSEAVGLIILKKLTGLGI